MTALNPFTGEFYRETLQMSRMTREMFCLMEGRHVHPSTLYPGGVGTVPTVQLFTDYLVRLMKYVRVHEEGRAAARRPVRLLLRSAARLRKSRPAAHSCSAAGVRSTIPTSATTPTRTWTNWGNAMYVTPGVVVDGKLVTTDLVDINLNIRILLGSSYYDDWENARNVREDRSAGQSGRPAPSLEPDHHPAAAEARLRRQVHLGDVAALVSTRRTGRPSGAGHRRRADRALLGDGAGRHGGHRLRQGHRDTA